MYKVYNITSDRWIFISCEDTNEPDEFVALVKEYSLNVSGSVKAYSEKTQYIIDKDPLKLIFQWDDLFGITVIVPDKTDIKLAEKTLIDLCESLNQKM